MTLQCLAFISRWIGSFFALWLHDKLHSMIVNLVSHIHSSGLPYISIYFALSFVSSGCPVFKLCLPGYHLVGSAISHSVFLHTFQLQFFLNWCINSGWLCPEFVGIPFYVKCIWNRVYYTANGENRLPKIKEKQELGIQIFSVRGKSLWVAFHFYFTQYSHIVCFSITKA